MANNLVSLLGWAFLPNLVTGYLQSILYAVLIRAGDPKPAPGSKRWVQDRTRIRIFVIVVYLLYTVVDADYSLRKQGDFYQNLGVSHDGDDKVLQSRFRRLTVQFHPDKATGADKAAVEAIYVQLKLARDTLVEPAKRFAYDRFGPEILQWQQCKSLRDFILHGVQRTAIYYVMTGGGLILLGSLGYVESGKFWRYLSLAGLFIVELHITTRPVHPWILTHVVNPFLITTKFRTPYLPYQFIALLRQLAITFFIALSQLGPLFQNSQALADGDEVSNQQLDQLDALARATDVEVSRLTALEVTPFATEPSSMTALRTTLKEWLVHNTVRNDPEVSAAMAQILERRRGQIGLQAQT